MSVLNSLYPRAYVGDNRPVCPVHGTFMKRRKGQYECTQIRYARYSGQCPERAPLRDLTEREVEPQTDAEPSLELLLHFSIEDAKARHE